MDIVSFLRNRYKYDPDTGVFTYAVDVHIRKIGDRADYRYGKGYRAVNGPYIDKKQKHVQAHRAAWAIVYGELPSGHLDHINRIRDDNRIVNLRMASRSLNRINSGLRSNNTSGFRGVFWYKTRNKWAAGIKVNGRRTHLGYFDSKVDAAVAYAKAAELYHGVQIKDLFSFILSDGLAPSVAPPREDRP
jgi:hypothetical protein